MWAKLESILTPAATLNVPGRWRTFETAAIATAGMMLYGAAMGCFSISDGHALQIAFSAVKTPLLLAVTFLLSLPVFYVLNALAGVAEDFVLVLNALIRTLSALGIILAALAPYTLLWYASTSDYHLAVTFNGIVLLAASASAQIVLQGEYKAFIARNRKHQTLFVIWFVLFCFVGIQAAWVLRPFIGSPHGSVAFLRPDAWSNAYVHVANLIFAVLQNGE